MTKVQKTSWGEEHGLVGVLPNSNADDGFKYMNAETKAKAEKLRKEESKIVKAKYINYKGKNNRLSKPYCRWSGDPIHMYHLIPDHVYELPMGLINEVNSNAGLAKRSEILDSQGIPTKMDGQAEKEHELIPVSF